MKRLRQLVLMLLLLILVQLAQCNILTSKNIEGYMRQPTPYPFIGQSFSKFEPEALGKIKFDYFIFNSNPLDRLEIDSFDYNVNLTALAFIDNIIGSIHPLTFHKLLNLTIINLNNNRIETIDERLFANNHKLEFLAMGSNQIRTIAANAFVNLQQLEVLHLRANRLKTFDINAVSATKVLRELGLERNELRTFDFVELKDRFPELTSVSFTGNEFNCSFAEELEMYLSTAELDVYDGGFISNNVTCIDDKEYAWLTTGGNILLREEFNQEMNAWQVILNERFQAMEVEMKMSRTALEIAELKIQLLLDQENARLPFYLI